MRRLVLVLVALGVVGLVALWLLTKPAVVDQSALPAYAPNTENGRIMLAAGGCSSCHATPDQADRTRLGGGLALKSPFGTFHVPNISSDTDDGIGDWTEAQFVTAMLKGTSPSGEHYYPSFPYTSYQRIRVEDVRDLFAYLKTLPAIPGKVRDHELPFPLNMRAALGVWKRLFLDGRPFEADAAQSSEWNRGAYLVEGPGHCAECHSPRNILGAIDQARRMAGGPDPEGEGWVPNITQAALGDWTADDFAELLRSGATPTGDSVGGSMRAVVRNTSQLPAADRAAMALYLKSLSPVQGRTRPEP